MLFIYFLMLLDISHQEMIFLLIYHIPCYNIDVFLLFSMFTCGFHGNTSPGCLVAVPNKKFDFQAFRKVWVLFIKKITPQCSKLNLKLSTSKSV